MSQAWPEPDQWRATSARALWWRADEGMLLGWRYGAWRVVGAKPVAAADPTEAEQTSTADINWPYVLVLADVHGPILDDTFPFPRRTCDNVRCSGGPPSPDEQDSRGDKIREGLG